MSILEIIYPTYNVLYLYPHILHKIKCEQALGRYSRTRTSYSPVLSVSNFFKIDATSESHSQKYEDCRHAGLEQDEGAICGCCVLMPIDTHHLYSYIKKAVMTTRQSKSTWKLHDFALLGKYEHISDQ